MQMAQQDMQQPNAAGGRAPEKDFSEPSPLVSQLQGESPALYYMRSKAIERALHRTCVSLTPWVVPPSLAMQPRLVSNLGNGVGDNNRERSFLERLSQSGLLSVLQGMPRAERMYVALVPWLLSPSLLWMYRLLKRLPIRSEQRHSLSLIKSGSRHAAQAA